MASNMRMVSDGARPCVVTGWGHRGFSHAIRGRLLGDKIKGVWKAIAAVAKVKGLEDWTIEGREILKEIMEKAGDIDDPRFTARFRAELRRRLREERGAGKVAAIVGETSAPDAQAAADRVRAAAKDLPESWVRAGNGIPLKSAGGDVRGAYIEARGDKPAFIVTDWGEGTELHEYIHHLQRAMPGAEALFRKLHRRRTKGEDRVVVGDRPDELGRKDQYVEEYMGREYGPGEVPKEVWPTAMQLVFHHFDGTDYTKELIRKDPELLDLVLGVLFRYDP